jgi:AcrR family transcriptional regulator
MANEKTAARRQRRIAARKAQILDAAAQVFAEKGFHRTTTREIAEAADVSEGTIYNYFASKDDLLIGIMAQLSESMQLDERFEQALLGDPRDFFTAMLRYRRDIFEQNYTMLQALLPEILVDRELGARYYQQLLVPVITLLEQHVQTRIERGQIRPINVPLAVRAFFALNAGLLVLLALGDPLIQSEWDDLVDVLTSVIFDGVGPTKTA